MYIFTFTFLKCSSSPFSSSLVSSRRDTLEKGVGGSRGRGWGGGARDDDEKRDDEKGDDGHLSLLVCIYYKLTNN